MESTRRDNTEVAGQRRPALVVEQAPAHFVALLAALHRQWGAGDGRVSWRMAQLGARAAVHDAALAVLWAQATGRDAADASDLWTVGHTDVSAGAHADLSTEEQIAPSSGVTGVTPRTPGAQSPPVATPQGATATLHPLDVGNDDTVTEGVGGRVAPGQVDGRGRLLAGRGERPVEPDSAAGADALEQMAVALEEGAHWPLGARTGSGQARLLGVAEAAVRAGLDADAEGSMPWLALARRLCAAGGAVAGAVLAHSPQGPLAAQAAKVLASLLNHAGAPTLQCAVASHLWGSPSVPPVLAAAAQALAPVLLPAAPPPWPPGHSGLLRARHLVYAPEYRHVRDAYLALGWQAVSERPLLLQRNCALGRTLCVELRRAHAAVLLAPEPQEDDGLVLILSGMAAVIPTHRDAAGSGGLVVALFRRDPWGVPRLAERFCAHQRVAAARGDRMLEDVALVDAIMVGMAEGRDWAAVRAAAQARAPQLCARTLFPHQPGALRAAGGAPVPLHADPQAWIPHPISAALPRANRRPADLRWRNDAPDATSHLALEVAAALACAPLQAEELPLLEPAGFHEGLPDVDVHTGAALWRVSLTRGLCGQAEEALAALVALHTVARRAQLLGDPPRVALLRGAARAARILTLLCAASEFASDVLTAVLDHAGLPAALALVPLSAAATDESAFSTLATEHMRWLQD